MNENGMDAGQDPVVPEENRISTAPITGAGQKKAGKRNHAARRDLMRENTQKRQKELQDLRNARRLREAEKRAEEEALRRAEKLGASENILPAENPVSEPESVQHAVQPVPVPNFFLQEDGKGEDGLKITEQDEKEREEPEIPEEEQALPVLEIDEEPEHTGKKPKKKRKKFVTALIAVGVALLSVIIIGAAAAFGIFNYFYNQSNYIAEGETYIPTAPPTQEGDETKTQEPVKEGVNYELLGSSEPETTAERKSEETEAKVPEINRTGVYNVLLVGIDIGSGSGNSDSMIVCSINYDLHKIFLTTLMRDSRVEIPGYGPRKLNSACAIGGPTMLEDTLEQYFGFKIDNFAMIDFEGMKAVINALGGVDLYLTVQEAAFMLIPMEEDQMVHLDGRLALRHARDRSSGGSDFGRTQRQRNVLMAIVKKARNGGLGDLVSAARAILPYITHNMSRVDLAELIRELPALVKWEFVQQRIPYDGLYTFDNEDLVMDIPATMQRWRAVVYDGEIFEDTIVEESTESAAEESEPSGEGTAEGEGDPEESGKEPGPEEPDVIPDDLLKLGDGVYKVSYRPDQYLNPIPEDFNYRNLITLTVWKDVKTMEELDRLLAFEATGEQVVGRQVAIYNGEYYIGSGRQKRFWKLEKWDGTLQEPETGE